MKFLLTGGAGFIGSAVIRFLINETNHMILNLDKLTYAGNLNSLAIVSNNPRYQFVHGDICDRTLVSKLFLDFKPNIVLHLAAESHVDRSIEGPSEFLQTNIFGTSVMLECAREYWSNLPSSENDVDRQSVYNFQLTKPFYREEPISPTRESFRFHHISTDEVFGSIDDNHLFTENSAYHPSSPYSASKASSDHLVRAWYRTYGLPILITNCSNNYGPYQFPEKLIPLMILNALEGKQLPIYGNGQQIRDWLYVEDHVRALYKVVSEGEVGETYNIGGHNEKKNIEVVNAICEILDELVPLTSSPKLDAYNELSNFGELSTSSRVRSSHFNFCTVGSECPNHSYKDLVKFVADRPGHDQRYAIDASKIQKKLGWIPAETFETGLRKTVIWYLENLTWCEQVRKVNYQGQRIGVNSNNNAV